MPRIPTYDQQTVEVRGLPGVRQESIASPGLFSAAAQDQIAMGNAVLNAGTALNNIAVKEQERENADLLFRAETALKTDYLEFENQARQRRGQEAWGLSGDAKKWWDEAGKKYSEGFTNDIQRKLFEQTVAKMRIQSVDGLSAYEDGQRRQSLQESAQASIVSSINMAAAMAGGLSPDEFKGGGKPSAPAVTTDAQGNQVPVVEQPSMAGGSRLQSVKTDILKRVQVLAKINGWSDEVRSAKEMEYLTNFHKQVIQARIDKDPDGAEAYFKANKGEINGADHDQIEKVIGIGGVKRTAQEFADQVTASRLTESQAIAVAREKFSGDRESAVVQEIKARYAEADAARERMQRGAADEAWSIFAKTGRLSAIPADVLSKMDGRSLMALRKEAQSGDGGASVKTDWDVYYKLRREAIDNPERFRGMDLRSYFDKLGKSEREGLIDLQTKAAKPDSLKEVATLDQQLSDAHDQLKIGKDAEQKGLFDRVVRGAISAEQTRLGRQLGYDERQKVIDRMMIEGEIDKSGFFRDDRGRMYQFQGREDVKNFIPKIPKTEKQKIEAALERAGRKVTDDEVIRLYKLKNGLQ